MVDVEFMFCYPIGGSGRMPLVVERRWDLEEEIRSKGVVLWLDGQGKCVVFYR